MRSLLDKSSWHETHQARRRPPTPEQLIDVDDAHAVLDFTYCYLEAHSRPPSDDEVHNVTATIARYTGPQVVRWADLELLLCGPFAMERT